MKGIIFKLLILVSFCMSCKKPTPTISPSEINILPYPTNVVFDEGSFEISKNTVISIDQESQRPSVQFFTEWAESEFHLSIPISEEEEGDIRFVMNDSLKEEAYILNVTPEFIEIEAGFSSGFLYAVQSLKQLAVSHINDENEKVVWLVPALRIDDAPRFNWRAYMLDESRYFHGEAFVKKVLDEMFRLKMNVFHWHLIDDAGWRLEIKKYPLLTEIGAFREDSEIGTWKSGKTAGEPHGGYYTQEQIRDIVAYAARRNINIVPEFEMPGHSSAAIASYTWLGTAKVDIDVPVKFGRHYDNYDVTDERVVGFIKDVLLEIFDLFPSKVIHIGGDEVGYKVWEESVSVQKYMKAKGIKTPADLQVSFTNEISQFMEENDRRMMGWNEILGKNIHKGFQEKKDDKEAETPLAKNVVVHFWKGDLNMATEAAKKGYDIVNSIHSNTYLDYSYESISLQKAYEFEPIPDGLEERYHKNIYGLGCQMWSEWTPTNADIEFQTFPRIAAYAEVGWSRPENKDYQRFLKALERIRMQWDRLQINYFKE